MKLVVEVTTCTSERTGIGYYTEHLVDALIATAAPGDEVALIGNRELAPLPAEKWAGRVRTDGAQVRYVWMQRDAGRMIEEAGADFALFPNYLAPLASPCPYVNVVHDLALIRTPQFFNARKRLLVRPLLLEPAQDVLEVTFFPEHQADRINPLVPGVRLIVAARRSGRPRLFTLDAASDRLVPLPATADRPARFPAVSPDGRWLAYAEEEGGGWQLTLLELATGLRRRLMDADCNAVTPIWQSDSQTLVYASDCGRGVGQTALYRVTTAR
ncbi:MAG TPA: hypothetical protein VFG23_06315 [Polyangia bacterium]|nr:hypothetical protein [Polyangia bacterium]